MYRLCHLLINLQTRMRSNPLGLHVWFFGQTLHLLARAFAVRLCDKYHNFMSWLNFDVFALLCEPLCMTVTEGLWNKGTFLLK